jgi:hypothetical protein
MNLTPIQIQMLAECCQYSISDLSERSGRRYFYRLGGHGEVPMRYNSKLLPGLARLGLVIANGGYSATVEGMKLNRDLNTPKSNGLSLKRTIEQHRGGVPAAMARQSQAAIQFAFDDARADILTLHRALEDARSAMETVAALAGTEVYYANASVRAVVDGVRLPLAQAKDLK